MTMECPHIIFLIKSITGLESQPSYIHRHSHYNSLQTEEELAHCNMKNLGNVVYKHITAVALYANKI